MATGLLCLELYKVLAGRHNLEDYRNTFASLARLPLFSTAESLPVPPKTIKSQQGLELDSVGSLLDHQARPYFSAAGSRRKARIAYSTPSGDYRCRSQSPLLGLCSLSQLKIVMSIPPLPRFYEELDVTNIYLTGDVRLLTWHHAVGYSEADVVDQLQRTGKRPTYMAPESSTRVHESAATCTHLSLRPHERSPI
ncbi:hypothetical protein OPV22_000435 [Ensete ventricosum]|uniref:Uncharacterized protein n=1 Tax=Ensete ventricosum TaxID=4639 RepID=A0AAV8QG62_ENSVE|nr:hypothetical protein OPV22_000435 [Ensete ventricosum]